MKTFALILYVLNPSGAYSSFAIQTGMTEESCNEAYVSWEATLDKYSVLICAAEVMQ